MALWLRSAHCPLYTAHRKLHIHMHDVTCGSAVYVTWPACSFRFFPVVVAVGLVLSVGVVIIVVVAIVVMVVTLAAVAMVLVLAVIVLMVIVVV